MWNENANQLRVIAAEEIPNSAEEWHDWEFEDKLEEWQDDGEVLAHDCSDNGLGQVAGLTAAIWLS